MNVEDLDMTHFFVGDEYAKLTKIDAGMKLTQHTHKFDHCSFLLIGRVEVEVDGEKRVLRAPCSLRIEADKVHAVTALTPALWACLWDNPEGITDPEDFDHSVIA